MAQDDQNPLIGLNDDQVAQIMHLQELTGEEDLTSCRRCLERCQWNIHIAVNQSLFGNGTEYNAADLSEDEVLQGDNSAGVDIVDDDIQISSSGSRRVARSGPSTPGEDDFHMPFRRRPLPADSMPFLGTTVRAQAQEDTPRFDGPIASSSADSLPQLVPPHNRRTDDDQLRSAILRQINRMERHRELLAGNITRSHATGEMLNSEIPPGALRRLPLGSERGSTAGGRGGGGNSLWQWVSQMIDYCYQWALVLLTAVWRFIQTLALPGANGTAGYLMPGAGVAGGDGGAVSAATILAEVEEFIRDFEAKYGSIHPNFYRGGFNQASRECIRQARFLVVYLHSPNAVSTDRFCSQVLCNTSVRDVINNAGNMLFWAGSIASRNSEGYRTLRKLRAVNTFPSLCFLTPVNQSMRLSAVIEGELLSSVPRLIDKIYECVAANAPHLAEINAEHQAHATNRAIRAEQDVQYLESLRADQEKEREKQRQLSKQREQELKAEQRHKARFARKQALELRKREALERLPAEPTSGELIRINLKFPSGVRVERRFSPTDDVQCVYYFALSQKETTEKFTVLTNFPRKPVLCSPNDPHISLKQADFKRAEALFVETEEDDGSSDSDEQEVEEIAGGGVSSTLLTKKQSNIMSAVSGRATAQEGTKRAAGGSSGDTQRNSGVSPSGAA